MKFKSIIRCNFQWSSYENGDASCSLWSDHLWREPRLNTSSNRKFSGLFQIFIVQFGESIHRKVQEAEQPSELIRRSHHFLGTVVVPLPAVSSHFFSLHLFKQPGDAKHRRFLSALSKRRPSIHSFETWRFGTTVAAIDQLLYLAM
jgi:hypothetical protein